MKELIPMNEYGLMADNHCVVRVDSRSIADVFGKQHKNVLRDIEKLTESKSGLSEEFSRLNFEPISYTDQFGRKQPGYLLTRDGFTMLAMGYSGEKAMRFKEQYINRFNEMEAQLLKLQSLRDQYPLLTKAITDSHETPKPYHYSNEMDMLNRIALGMTAKQYREAHGIDKGEPIRPHLEPEELELLDVLQQVDIGLNYSMPDFQQRKHMLEWYAKEYQEKKVTVPAA